jgi:transposase
MLKPDQRLAVFLLHQQGLGFREIALRMRISRNSVRRIVRQQGRPQSPNRPRKPRPEEELLRQLYRECQGYIQRVWEKLTQEHRIRIEYSTLTRLLRELGISTPQAKRCGHVPDEPGVEMQQDTSPFRVRLAGLRVILIACMLYLRYSKRRFLRFYRVFNRFQMKCFFHQALTYWEYAARDCIIDNTNLARLRGTGANALIVPEMAAFAQRYGFVFVCHERGHANRKAGEERSFYTVETNFIPGRTFTGLEDLNRQALEWSTVTMEHRPQGKARLIPAKSFEHEQGFLTPVCPELCPPYLELPRHVDEYGYAACEGNFYWVPGLGRAGVKLLRYDKRLEIYSKGQRLVEYPLPPDGTKNERFSPPGQPTPRNQPRHQKRPPLQEEAHLRKIGPLAASYLEYALKPKGIERNRLIRELYALANRLSPKIFTRVLERALRYGVADVPTLCRIAVLILQQDGQVLPPQALDEGYRDRESYREGSVTDLPDLSRYQDPDDPPAEPEPENPAAPNPESDHG